jgi:hypothetical protein
MSYRTRFPFPFASYPPTKGSELIVTALNTTSTAERGPASGYTGVEDWVAGASRYWLDLTRDTTVRVSDVILRDGYGSQHGDDVGRVRPLKAQRHLAPTTWRYPANPGMLWFLQEAAPTAAIHQYRGQTNERLAALGGNRYLPDTRRLFCTPMQVNATCMSGLPDGTISIVPEGIEDLMGISDTAAIPDLSGVLPEIWTLHRLNPGMWDLPADKRRALYGHGNGWADDDGPISFLGATETKAIQDNPALRAAPVYILEVKDPTRPNKEEGYSFKKGTMADVLKGKCFGIIRRTILCYDDSTMRIVKQSIVQLVHFGASFVDIATKPEHAPIAIAVQHLLGDMWNGANPWKGHPREKEKYKSLTKYHGGAVDYFGPAITKALAQGDGLQEFEEITKSPTGFVNRSQWGSMSLPKYLDRTEKGRTYRRALAAVFQKEKTRTQLEVELQRIVVERAKILSARQVQEAQIKEARALIARLETSVSASNAQKRGHDEKIARVAKDLSTLQGQAEKHKMTMEDVLADLGATSVPNMFQTWMKQNWLILDVEYKNRISNEIASIKTHNDLPGNENWWLYRITVRTIRPNIIRVGARATNGWEEQYGKIVGGPYKFVIWRDVPDAEPKVTIQPAEKGAIFGVHPGYRKGAYGVESVVKLHPHTNQTNIMVRNAREATDFWQKGHHICLGEAVLALYQAFKQEDITVILLTLDSWSRNADPLDHWGKEYKWFPKPEEVPCVAYEYSYEQVRQLYVSSTGDTNHLFYEISYTDGLPGLTLRYGSMVMSQDKWVVPTERGRTTHVETKPEENSKEAQSRIVAALKKGYQPLNPDTVIAVSISTQQNNIQAAEA